MPKYASRLLSALSAAAAALMLSALPAVAGVAIDETTCEDIGGTVGVACFSTKGEANTVETPSGSVIFQYNVRFDYTITRPDGHTISGSAHEHWAQVAKKGEVQQYNYFTKKTINDSFTGETCTLDEHLVYSNGEVRHVDQEATCS